MEHKEQISCLTRLKSELFLTLYILNEFYLEIEVSQKYRHSQYRTPMYQMEMWNAPKGDCNSTKQREPKRALEIGLIGNKSICPAVTKGNFNQRTSKRGKSGDQRIVAHLLK